MIFSLLLLSTTTAPSKILVVVIELIELVLLSPFRDLFHSSICCVSVLSRRSRIIKKGSCSGSKAGVDDGVLDLFREASNERKLSPFLLLLRRRLIPGPSPEEEEEESPSSHFSRYPPQTFTMFGWSIMDNNSNSSRISQAAWQKIFLPRSSRRLGRNFLTTYLLLLVVVVRPS